MVTLPRDIPSAVTDAEAHKLAELAAGKRVLELGAHYGFSTIVLAQTASELHSVDWHKGDSQAGHGDNLLTYRQNLRRHGVEDKVVSHVGRFEDVVPAFRSGYFHGIFLDGEHDRASVERDLDLILDMAPDRGMWIALHDYGRFEVKPVVDEMTEAWSGLGYSLILEVVDWLAVVHLPRLIQ